MILVGKIHSQLEGNPFEIGKPEVSSGKDIVEKINDRRRDTCENL